MDDVINRHKTEYSSHSLPVVVGEKHENNLILVRIYRIDKWQHYQD